MSSERNRPFALSSLSIFISDYSSSTEPAMFRCHSFRRHYPPPIGSQYFTRSFLLRHLNALRGHVLQGEQHAESKLRSFADAVGATVLHKVLACRCREESLTRAAAPKGTPD